MCDACFSDSRTFNRRALVRVAGLGAGVATLSVVGSRFWDSTLAQQADATPSPGEPAEAHWSYEGETGPEHWGELDPEYATCSGGTEQSPIDIVEPSETDFANPEFDYGSISPLRIINNGHTVQVNVPPGHSVTVDETSYELQQFHFHAPSEHSIDGRAQAMELHLVHRATDDTVTVVGVLLEEGAEHAALKPVFQAMPVMAGPEQEVTGTVDLASLVPTMQTTYRYLGSLTTPPCTEGVNWVLFTTPAGVSTAQVEAFRKLLEGDTNARPVQPLNDREVEEDTTP